MTTGFDPSQFMQAAWAQARPFDALATELWAYQVEHNPIMAQYTAEIGQEGPHSIPISFFKHRAMKTGNWDAAVIYESSGTTGQVPSQHHVKELALYETNVLKGFEAFFPEERYRILALLPSYLERGNSSLVHMVKVWIDYMGLPGSGFYLQDIDALEQAIYEGMESEERIILIGVTFALLDFVESRSLKLPADTIVIETGGMKGRREELTREAVHLRLREGLGVSHIFSEYGMTEMMSQAYLGVSGRFHPAPTLKVRISDLHLSTLDVPFGRSGRIHIIDLANVHSCAFIATDDIGRMYPDGSFEVLGRIDTAELRGCNLMYV